MFSAAAPAAAEVPNREKNDRRVLMVKIISQSPCVSTGDFKATPPAHLEA